MIARAIRRHPLVVIWILAAAIRSLYIMRAPEVVFGDAAEYDVMARTLLAGEGLGVEAVGFVRPPLYAVFVALCYALGGMVALQVAQVVLGATTTTLISFLAGRFSRNGAGVWGAALLAAAYPWSIQYVGSLASETLFTFFVVASFLGMFAVLARPALVGALGTGLLFGLACLIRANFLLLAPALAFLIYRRGSRAAAVLFLVGSALALAPFSLYSYAQGWGPLLGSGSGGLSFYVGNNHTVAQLFIGDLSDEEWRRLNSLGPAEPSSLAFLGCPSATTVQHCADHLPISQRDRFFYDAGIRYIRSAPGEWAAMTAMKIVRQWTPWVEPRAYPLPVVLMSGLSFGAIVVLAALGLRGLRPEAIWLIALIALAVTATAVLALVQLRYRFPLLDPALIAASGATFERFVLFAPRSAARLLARR